MTNKEKVLAVHVCASAHQELESGAWGIFTRIGQTFGQTKWFATEEAAWQNAAESLPAAPDQETDEKDDAWKSMVESILPEPVAPVEAQEKEPEVGFHCRWCDKPIFQNGDGTWYHRATVRTHCDRVAEPKPTPSVECNEQEFPGPIPSNCPKCGETIWGEGWNPNTGIRYFSHVPKPQPDSSSIPSTEPNDMQKQMAHDDGLIATLQEDTKRLRQERAEWQRKYFEISRALSGTIDKNGDLIKRIQWLEHEKDEIRNSKTEARDSSSISTEQTFEDVLRNRAGEYQDMGREHRKNEEYAAACTCEDKASGLYVAIKLYRIWNAAKGQS